MVFFVIRVNLHVLYERTIAPLLKNKIYHRNDLSFLCSYNARDASYIHTQKDLFWEDQHVFSRPLISSLLFFSSRWYWLLQEDHFIASSPLIAHEQPRRATALSGVTTTIYPPHFIHVPLRTMHTFVLFFTNISWIKKNAFPSLVLEDQLSPQTILQGHKFFIISLVCTRIGCGSVAPLWLFSPFFRRPFFFLHKSSANTSDEMTSLRCPLLC